MLGMVLRCISLSKTDWLGAGGTLYKVTVAGRFSPVESPPLKMWSTLIWSGQMVTDLCRST